MSYNIQHFVIKQTNVCDILPLSLSLSLFLSFSLSLSLPPSSTHVQLKVSHQQLVMLQGAFAAYFSGNHQAVDGLLKEFRAKLEEIERSNEPPEWLENMSGHGSQDGHH